MRNLVASLLVLTLFLPAAAAAVTVDHVLVPPSTAAEKAFNVSVSLTNDGPARSVYLFGALYDRANGSAPCGPATDAHFRTFTHTVQETITLPANSVTTFPPEGGRWLQKYGADDATPAPEVAQFCVFVANATAGPTIDYESFATTSLSVRAKNTPPSGGFTWTPDKPAAGEEAAFEGTATDKEGDPVTFRWDFGRYAASGRSEASGPSATSTFYPDGRYVVTLILSDGLNESHLSRTITIGEQAASSGGGVKIPSLGVGMLLAVVVLVALRRR